MDQVVVQQVPPKSPLLTQVIKLADENVATLGFMPHKAFEDYASKKGVLAAIINEKLAGYILHRNVKRQNHARIVHLCVASDFRGLGVARVLFEELKQRSSAMRGIGLLCRRDYENANEVWRKLGLRPISEKPGRGQIPSTLTFWWYDNGHPTLFDYIDVERLKVAIDANIFFDLQQKQSKNLESLALDSDWLKDEIVLVVTPELLHEINRNSNPHVRQKHRHAFQSFLETQVTQSSYDQIRDELGHLFPKPRTTSQESDLNQVAWSIADSDVNFFVTRDEGLLKQSAIIFAEFGLSVLHPVDLILHVDELHRIEEYRKMRLAGTSINQRRVQSGEHQHLADLFQNDHTENKSDFLQLLRDQLIETSTRTCMVAQDRQQGVIALFVLDRSKSGELAIPLFRCRQKNPSKKLVRYLILLFQTIASNEGRNLTKISDPGLQEIAVESLQEDAFIQLNASWIKINLLMAAQASEVGEHLESILVKLPELRPYFQLHSTLLCKSDGASNTDAMIEIERMFWPVKITDAAIDALTVPIDTTWASLWFDSGLAEQTLFGANEERALNREGVYYSAAKRPNISLPARVLWYVTRDPRVSGSQSIRACSRLEDVVVGKPKDLFRQFQHLGIYEWKNVFDVAKGDLEQEIMALRFSDTHLFSNPVTFEQWRKLTTEATGKNPPIYSPTVMPNSIFAEIYQMGIRSM